MSMRFPIVLLLLTLPITAMTAEKTALCDGCEIVGHLRDGNMTSFTIDVKDAMFSAAQEGTVKNWMGSAPDTTPNRVTTLVDLRIGGVRVPIPYQAYMDLGNPGIPYGVSLSQDENGIYLFIRGGDGPYAYVAKFVVINGKLARREVLPTNSPDAAPKVTNFDGTARFR
jgi:hypothetical protein